MGKYKLKTLLLLYFALSFSYNAFSINNRDIYNVRKYGAKGNGRNIDTESINHAIDICNKSGGGTVLIPKGIYLIGTVVLKNDVSIYLEEGAVLKGTSDLKQYKSFVPMEDLSMYDSGNGSSNENNSKDAHWNRALVLGVGVNNVSIDGQGTIDGCHVLDTQGEEKMRGPHTIIIAESRNFEISGITLNRASNYAFLAYRVENAVFRNIKINEGWDGIHIRGGKNITIRNCHFHTGDDAIAGGYWENMTISDCNINSSCNGIRMIMPASDLTISHCTFAGPGKYPHRTSGVEKRRNMLSAIILQPGGWGKSPGDIDRIHLYDINIYNVNNPLMVVLNKDNNSNNICVEKFKADSINMAAISFESWKGGVFRHVVLKDISVNYRGNADPKLNNIILGLPPADARILPCWGLYLKNVTSIVLNNIQLNYTGSDSRPAFLFNNVGKAELDNVRSQGKYIERGKSLVSENSGEIIIKNNK